MKNEENRGMRRRCSTAQLLMFCALLLTVAAGLCGCGGGSSTAVQSGTETITIQPADNRLYVGATKQYSLVSSQTGAITTSVGWGTSNPLVATISAGGVLLAVGVGDATITATVAGVPFRTTTLKVIATTFANVSSVVTPLNVAGVWKGTYEILEAKNQADIGTYDFEFNLSQAGTVVSGQSSLRAASDPRFSVGTLNGSSVSGDVLDFNFTYFDTRALYNLVNSGFAKIKGTVLTGEAVENDINGWNCRYRFNVVKQ